MIIRSLGVLDQIVGSEEGLQVGTTLAARSRLGLEQLEVSGGLSYAAGLLGLPQRGKGLSVHFDCLKQIHFV